MRHVSRPHRVALDWLFDRINLDSKIQIKYIDTKNQLADILTKGMFESRISAGGEEKLPFPQNLRISSWSFDMAGHAKKCVERYCELANKTTQQLYKVSTPCIDDHHFKEEEMKSVGELSQNMLSNCSEMLILGKNWTTRYSMVSEQTCTIDYEMDQSL